MKYATDRGLDPDPEAVAANADVHASIMAHIDKINEKFARVEQVKKVKVLPRDFTHEGGELTPSMKVKRSSVAVKYEADVEALYSG